MFSSFSNSLHLDKRCCCLWHCLYWVLWPSTVADHPKKCRRIGDNSVRKFFGNTWVFVDSSKIMCFANIIELVSISKVTNLPNLLKYLGFNLNLNCVSFIVNHSRHRIRFVQAARTCRSYNRGQSWYWCWCGWKITKLRYKRCDGYVFDTYLFLFALSL